MSHKFDRIRSPTSLVNQLRCESIDVPRYDGRSEDDGFHHRCYDTNGSLCHLFEYVCKDWLLAEGACCVNLRFPAFSREIDGCFVRKETIAESGLLTSLTEGHTRA